MNWKLVIVILGGVLFIAAMIPYAYQPRSREPRVHAGLALLSTGRVIQPGLQLLDEVLDPPRVGAEVVAAVARGRPQIDPGLVGHRPQPHGGVLVESQQSASGPENRHARRRSARSAGAARRPRQPRAAAVFSTAASASSMSRSTTTGWTSG